MSTATKARGLVLPDADVRAVLSGAKTQHRVPVKPQPSSGAVSCYPTDSGWEWWGPTFPDGRALLYEHSKQCPLGSVGDLLYVREAWGLMNGKGQVLYGDAELLWRDHYDHMRGYSAMVAADLVDGMHVLYRADGEREEMYWRPCSHMPRWAARLWLRITAVRVQRITDINDVDADAEGFPSYYTPAYVAGGEIHGPDGRQGEEEFLASWNKRYPGSWERNDWVWAITFARTEKP